MSAPSDTFDPTIAATPPAPAHAVRPFFWSVRRELWENRSLFVAPLIAAAVVLLGFVVSMSMLSHFHKLDSMADLDSGDLVAPYAASAALVMFAGFVVALFYSLGALHNERRDRSILFWKSMPVSDLLTVLSKAAIPLLVMPAIVVGVVLPLQLVMAVVESLVFAAHGLSVMGLWGSLDPASHMLMMIYGLVAAAIWYVPVFGWLFLVSGWARRVTFLWAILPPIGLCVFEQIALGTHYVAGLLGHRLFGAADAAFNSPTPGGAMHVMLSNMDPLGFIGRPDVWLGIAVGAAFFGAAVWLRRYRDPI
jgi:ABC-2 type transport system permease protein